MAEEMTLGRIKKEKNKGKFNTVHLRREEKVAYN